MADPKDELRGRQEEPEETARRRGRGEEREQGLEGAAEEDAGVFRREEGVEGGDELSIGGGPPSAAGGTRGSPAPTHEDLLP
jgi:hypothetical protein